MPMTSYEVRYWGPSQLATGRLWRKAAVPRHFRLWGQSQPPGRPPRPL